MTSKSSQPDDISCIVKQILDSIPDKRLAESIWQAFVWEGGSLKRIERVFLRLTEKSWGEPTLKRFFHAWKDTHLSSGSVAALVCRLLDEPRTTSGFVLAARSIAQVIHEDLGLAGETHAVLYERLANQCCGSDEWKLDACCVLSAAEFGRWVHKQRVDASIEEALLTTIASEIYNHGEYSFIAPHFRLWLTDFCHMHPLKAQSSLAYILVHTGATESDHFLSGIEALEHYLQAKGKTVDYAKVTEICRSYLNRLAAAFDGITMCLHEESPAISQAAMALNSANATVCSA